MAQLTRLSTELVDALNLYHQLMRELPATPQYPYAAGAPAGAGAGYAPPMMSQMPMYSAGYAPTNNQQQQMMQQPNMQHPQMATNSAGKIKSYVLRFSQLGN